MLALALMSCNNNVFNVETVDTNLALSKDMLVFEGCTLVSRGMDDDGYWKHVILVENDTCPDDFLYVLYKDSCNYHFERIKGDSCNCHFEGIETGNTSPFDTTRMLKILSTAERLNINEIYSCDGRGIIIYLKHKEKPVIVSLDEP